MNETLTCTVCDKKWQRVRTRGRKPVVCPACAAQETIDNQELMITPKIESTSLDIDSDIKNVLCSVYNTYYPKDVNVKNITQSKSNVKWVCPKCNYKMTTVIPLVAAPLHKCSKNTSSLIELSIAK